VTRKFAVHKSAAIPALVTVVLMMTVISVAGLAGQDTGPTDKADSTGRAQQMGGSDAHTAAQVPARFTVRDDELPMPVARLVDHAGLARDEDTSPVGMMAGALAGAVVISAAGAIWYTVRRRRYVFPVKKMEKAKPEVSAAIETPDFEKRTSAAPQLVRPAKGTPLGRALVLLDEREAHAARIDRLMKKLLKARAMGR